MPPKLPIRLSPIAPAIMANDRRRLPVDKEKTDGAKHPGGNYAMYMVTCVHDKNVKEERQKLIDIVKNAGCNVVLTAAASGGFSFVAPPGCPDPLHDYRGDDVLVQSQPLEAYAPVVQGEPGLPAVNAEDEN